MFDDAEILERFELGSVLGKGGFGTTRSAKDRETGERVAIKRIDLSEIRDWKAIELFEREANALRSLDHPSIPKYIEFYPIEAEKVGYLVQELAEGYAIGDLLAGGKFFSEEECRDLALNVLDIIEYLSKRHVVHRDIKPANLVMGDNGLYLVDFGSVREMANQTQGGSTVAGTFGYMAPEQLHGEATTASDLYGLGMTLIHMLTGTPPEKLPKRRLKPDFASKVKLSPSFQKLIDALIEPIPEDRPQNAKDARKILAADLDDPVLPLLQAQRAEAELKNKMVAAEQHVAESKAMIKRGRHKANHVVVTETEYGGKLFFKPPTSREPIVPIMFLVTVAAMVGFAFANFSLVMILTWLVITAVVLLSLQYVGNPTLRIAASPHGLAVQIKRLRSRVFASDGKDVSLGLYFPRPDDVFGSMFLTVDGDSHTFVRLTENELRRIEGFCEQHTISYHKY